MLLTQWSAKLVDQHQIGIGLVDLHPNNPSAVRTDRETGNVPYHRVLDGSNVAGLTRLEIEYFDWFGGTQPGPVVESRKGAVPSARAPARFPSPLIKPDVPISSIRLSDRFHQPAHGRLAQNTSRKRKTPIFPNTTLAENLEVPSEGTFWRRFMKCLTLS